LEDEMTVCSRQKAGRRALPVVALVVAAALSVASSRAEAFVPSVTLLEGFLSGTGGGPVSDGSYLLTFQLYGSESGGVAAWTEGPVAVQVSNGQFQHGLGSKTALDVSVLGKLGTPWLSLQIESDPALPRQPLRSVPFSLRAAVAEATDCTGCIRLGQIDPAVLAPLAILDELSTVATTGEYIDLYGIPDLSVYAKLAALAKVATSGTYGDLAGRPDLTAFAKSAALAKVATSGAYGDLAGQPDLTAFAKSAALAKVATSGTYGDLAGTPDLSSFAELAALAKVATSGTYADLEGTPDLSPFATLASLSAVATSGSYGDLNGTPDLSPYATLASLASVATSGSYGDLNGTPDLSPYATLASLASVATSGSYGDLNGAPDLSVYATLASLASVATSGSYGDLNGAPDLSVYATIASLATVAFNGAYTSLTNLPTLPTLGMNCGAGLVLKGLKADGTYNCVDGSAITGGGTPAGAVMTFNLSACPTGWTELTEARGRYLVGRPLGGTVGLTGGAYALSNGEDRPVGQHTHSASQSAHAHSLSIPLYRYYTSSGYNVVAAGYTGYGQYGTYSSSTGAVAPSVSIGSAGSYPGTNAPYLQLLVCQKN
jgi:hypothetical protein